MDKKKDTRTSKRLQEIEKKGFTEYKTMEGAKTAASRYGDGYEAFKENGKFIVTKPDPMFPKDEKLIFAAEKQKLPGMEYTTAPEIKSPIKNANLGNTAEIGAEKIEGKVKEVKPFSIIANSERVTKQEVLENNKMVSMLNQEVGEKIGFKNESALSVSNNGLDTIDAKNKINRPGSKDYHGNVVPDDQIKLMKKMSVAETDINTANQGVKLVGDKIYDTQPILDNNSSAKTRVSVKEKTEILENRKNFLSAAEEGAQKNEILKNKLLEENKSVKPTIIGKNEITEEHPMSKHVREVETQEIIKNEKIEKVKAKLENAEIKKQEAVKAANEAKERIGFSAQTDKEAYAAQPKYNSKMDKIISETKYGTEDTMKTSGVFTEDASKYNLKNIAELEAKVDLEIKKSDGMQIKETSTADVAKSKLPKWLGGKDVELVDNEFNFKSDIAKGGEVSGNYGKFEENAKPEDITKLGNIKQSLSDAKNTVLKEMYEPASKGSDVHFERGIIKKLDDVQLTKGLQTENASDYLKQLNIDDDTKVSWSKTEDGGLEGIYKKAREVDGINIGESKTVYDSHKLRVNFGKDGAISGFENQKLDAQTGEWAKNEAKIDLGNGQQVGIERAKEIAKMNEKQVRMDMIKQNRQAVADGVEGAKSMGTMEKLKLKLGKGAKAEEAKTILENAKTAVKSHTEATEVMAKNIGGILGESGRVDLKAISAAASGAVEGASKEAGKNIHAGGNNTGKGMKSLLVLAGVGMAFGAVKATFDNSAEQRRQKQLELMAMRQQYGGAM